MTIPIDEHFYEKMAKLVFSGVNTKIDFDEKEKEKEPTIDISVCRSTPRKDRSTPRKNLSTPGFDLNKPYEVLKPIEVVSQKSMLSQTPFDDRCLCEADSILIDNVES